jgi:hypothetical protein
LLAAHPAAQEEVAAATGLVSISLPVNGHRES